MENDNAMSPQTRYDTPVIITLLLLTGVYVTYLSVGKINIPLLLGGGFLIVYNIKYFLHPLRRQWALLLLPLTMLASALMHRASLDPVSLLYGYFYLCLYYVLVARLANGTFGMGAFERFLRFLMSLLFWVLVLQQLMRLAGMEELFKPGISDKFSSLTAEASHLSSYAFMCMYAYLKCREIRLGRRYGFGDVGQDWKQWLMFVYMCTTNGSVFGFLFLAMCVVVAFVNKRNFWYFGVGISALLVAAVLMADDFTPLKRISDVVTAFAESDDFSRDFMHNGDMSSAMRVVPTVKYFNELDLLSLNTWVGEGMNYMKRYFAEFVGFGLFEELNVGVFPTFPAEYGLVNFFVFCLVLARNAVSRQKWGWDIMLIFALSVNSGFNTQMFWFMIMTLTVSKYFYATLLPECKAGDADV